MFDGTSTRHRGRAGTVFQIEIYFGQGPLRPAQQSLVLVAAKICFGPGSDIGPRVFSIEFLDCPNSGCNRFLRLQEGQYTWCQMCHLSPM